MDLLNKVALITGGSGGIGAACAEEFRRRGAKLALLARDESALRKVAGEDALILPGDVTNAGFREKALERVLDTYGRVDLLVNNAGVGLYEPAWSASPANTAALFDLNFFAALGMIQLCAPVMRRQGVGFIVNVTSIAAEITLPWLTLYSASKSALGSLTRGLRMELRGSGVKLMEVLPGYVETGFQQHALAGEPPVQLRKRRPLSITAGQCAAAIAQGVERDARTVVTPANGWLLIWLRRFSPTLVDERLVRMRESAQ